MTNSSFDRQRPFQPLTERSIYKPADGWVGGTIEFPDSRSWHGTPVDARIEIAGSTKRGHLSLKVSETWVTEKGRHMERIISMDINAENVRALHAELTKIIEGAAA